MNHVPDSVVSNAKVTSAKVTSAIVLCAGRGKRLKPFTDKTPKPLLPVGGVPTLDYILIALQRAGIRRLVLVTHYLSDQIETYAKQQTIFPTDLISCVQQRSLAGTADATLAALQAKPDWFEQAFLLTASDYLVPPPFYEALLTKFNQSQCKVGISIKRLSDAELTMRSSVRFDERGNVSEVVEKPAAGTAPSAFSANLVYVLPADIVRSIAEVAPSSRGEKEIQTAINRYLSEHGAACVLEQEPPQEWHPDIDQ